MLNQQSSLPPQNQNLNLLIELLKKVDNQPGTFRDTMAKISFCTPHLLHDEIIPADEMKEILILLEYLYDFFNDLEKVPHH